MAYTTIDNPAGEYFNTKLYTGNGSTQSITGVGFQPDWTWIKYRNSSTFGHDLYDSVRGATKVLNSNTEGEEYTEVARLSAFTSDGFNLGGETPVNENNGTFVSWNWKKSATAGFDIVGYTGNGSARTISHSLSAVPSMMIVKSRSSADKPWCIYHHKNTSAPETDFLSLNNTNATADNSAFWNDTAPTSSVFSVKNSNDVNQNGTTYIAYLFSEKKGYSKFGSYSGNGNADGSFIYTGFKPAFLIIRRTDDGDNWVMFDNKRNEFNLTDKRLYPNSAAVEATASSVSLDLLSNGFKLRGTDSQINNSSGTYIYLAFAENPFVTSTGIPTLAR